MNLPEYFATARERYTIYLKRLNKDPFPWTQDPVFKKYRFCNVFRELDRTTVWFREQVRDPLSKAKHPIPLRIVEATLIFRWFNRIETGTLVRDLLINGWDTEEARERLADVKPLVTGAYMIKSPDGMDKLDGLLWAIEMALKQLPAIVNGWTTPSIQHATEDLTKLRYLGPFLAYEVVTDLRHTPVLWLADDIHSWANPGPGCARGMGWLMQNDEWTYQRHRDRDELIHLMQIVQDAAAHVEYWPEEWPRWEMRDCEHWACEYDKWKRGTKGERLKRNFTLEP